MEHELVTREEFKHVVDIQEKITKVMFGNGEPGWDELLRDILKWIEKQEKAAEKRSQWWDRLQWIVIPIVVASVLAFLVQFVIFWVRIVPTLPKI